MLIFLLSFLTFLKTNHKFHKPELIPLSKKRSLSLMQSQWYYVHYQTSKDIKKIKSQLPHLQITSLSFYEDYLTLFLTPSEAKILNSLDHIKVYTRSNKKTILKALPRNETFLIQAHSSFTAPKYSKLISHDGPFYIIKTSDPLSIIKDPTVLTLKQLPPIYLQNRWTTGFLQSGDENLILSKDGYLTSNRKYNNMNLTGDSVIVTLVDTGTDMNNCLFNDPNQPTPLNTTNYNHRKVVRYDPFVDATDQYAGHGTHCAGIIAGKTDILPVSLYNGQAPNAKLYVADIGRDIAGEISVDLSSMFEIIENSRELNSPIVSCSWGTNVSVPELTSLFDYMSYTEPSQLFVFAAGNDGLEYTIGSPSDSKNVLSVAASYPTRAFFLGYPNYNIIKIEKNDQVLNATSQNSYLVIENRKSDFLNNVDVVTFGKTADEKLYEGKAVVIPNEEDSKNLSDIFDLLVKYEAKAAIVFDNVNASSEEIFVLSVNSSDRLFFEGISIVNITIDTRRGFDNVTVAPFSSQGPSALGNRKPDVMAPGFYISSAGNHPFPDECDISSSILQMSGTSMATPAVSGTLALVYEYLTKKVHKLPVLENGQKVTSSLLRAFAVAASGDKSDNAQGFGNINLSRVLVYPETDADRGLRFTSGEIHSNEGFSFTLKTTKEGPFSVSLAWIDLPLSADSAVPLFAYLDLIVVCPDGRVFESEEQFSTTKKVSIEKAAIGEYEIRVRSNTVQEIEEAVYYSIVAVGGFDHLDFQSNPGRLTGRLTSSCTSLCQNCDLSSSRCVCDPLKTGTNCEETVIDVAEDKSFESTLNNRQFLYMRFDITKHHSMSEKDIGNSVIDIKVKCHNRRRGSDGLIRYFLNKDNKVRLNLPRYSIAYQDEAVSSFQIPLADVIDIDAVYLTAFNDIYSNVSISLKWSVTDTRNIISRFVGSRIFKILMITLIVVFSLTIVGSIVAIVVCIILKKKRRRKRKSRRQKENTAGEPNTTEEMKDALIENSAEQI